MLIFMKHLLLSLASCLMVLTGFAHAAVGTERVTLQEAIRSALQERPMVQAQAAQSEAARRQQAAAASGYLPRLSLEERFSWTNEPAGSLFISMNQQDLKVSQDADFYNNAPSRKDFETRLKLNQSLFDADIGFNSKRMGIEAAAAAARERYSREAAALAVIEAFLAIQKQTVAETQASTALRESEEVQAIARQREEAGVGLKSETLRAQTLTNKAQLALLTARHALRLAKDQLAFAMGREEAEVDIAAPLTLDTLPPPGTINILRRGDLEALRLQTENARLAARQAEAGFLPKAGLEASYLFHDADLPFGTDASAWNVMAGLSWQFFDGFERSHREAAAEASRRASAARSREATRQMLLDIREVRLREEQAALAVELARSARLAAAEAKAITLERYKAGIAPLIELLSIQNELEKARLSLVTAETERIRLRAQTHYLQGSLLQALSAVEGEDPE